MSGNFNRSSETLAKIRAGMPDILQGLANASGFKASDFMPSFYADREGHDMDNLRFDITHKPSGAVVFGYSGWNTGKYEFKAQIPTFKRSRIYGLDGFFSASQQAEIGKFEAGFSVPAMAKNWQSFGRALWKRVFALTVEHWHKVTDLQEREAREDAAALAVCEKLTGMGWVVRSSGAGRGWYAQKEGADSIDLDEYGRAKPSYAYRTYDPERLAAFLEAEGKAQGKGA